MDKEKKAMQINPRDNVAVVLEQVAPDETVQVMYENKTIGPIIAKNAIDIFHKIAIAPIGKGETILKYGEVIGKAVKTIEPGEHVHVENLKGVTMTNEN